MWGVESMVQVGEEGEVSVAVVFPVPGPVFVWVGVVYEYWCRSCLG